MAKRMTDSTKWNDEWFSELSPNMKLVWLYILDMCDHAGVYKVNLKLLKFQTGVETTEEEILHYLKDRIYPTDNNRWFIPKFITFQYKNFFTSKQPAVVSARELLLSHNIIQPNDNTLPTISKGLDNHSITLIEELNNPYDRVKEQEKDKDKSKDIEKDKEFREDMYEYMDKVFEENTITNTNTGVINKILNNLIQLDDSKKHFQAVEDLEEIGGIDYIADILRWDNSVKNNWTQKIYSSNQIHSGIFPD
jgi:hypothetical protein